MDTYMAKDLPFPQSPVVPEMVDGGKTIQFQCRKGIACWNACCSNIDISLTPYDILRLKRRLGMASAAFLQQYAVPYEMEKDGIAGIKMKPVEGGSACQFMKPEGCGVYEDRPTACRYYPVALLSMRKQDEYTDTHSYALVKEAHCLGHNEPRSLTIDDYRTEQGIREYDGQGRGWRQLVLKKMSSGPTVGKPSVRSRQLFFMTCYDIDTFRAFVDSEPFKELYDLPEGELQAMLGDSLESEEALMQFGYRFLRQVLFGEESIPLHKEAAEKRREQARAKAQQAEREAAENMAREEDPRDEGFDD
ncbi:MAG: YkgJ family cysteine cluster protein [Sulfuritalea sp.]|nr:YkgJ family cysteine cluster protein [Sulfuritalea sp.]